MIVFITPSVLPCISEREGPRVEGAAGHTLDGPTCNCVHLWTLLPAGDVDGLQ